MKTLLTILLLSITTLSYSQKRVGGYIKSNGTYVEPYYRTAPNETKSDNYSTKGNYNPYTGKWGTKNIATDSYTYYSDYPYYYQEKRKFNWWVFILVTVGGGFLIAESLK